jgi:hypothetical protein
LRPFATIAEQGETTMTAGTLRPRLLIKIALVLVVLAGLGFLFMRTVTGTRAEPYTVPGESLRNWRIVLEPASAGSEPLLALRPPPDLVTGLFGQVFKRVMESMNAPEAPGIPLLLKGEFDRAFAGRVTPAALAASAREAGLDAAPLVPLCLGHRRVSEVSSTKQLYFVLFDAPAFARFRTRIGALLGEGTPRSEFDPALLSPVLFIAVSESTFSYWLPLHVDPKTDCVAPIVTSP